MNTVDDFLALLRDELGLPVTAHDLNLDLHDVAGWDSVQLLLLLTLMERRYQRSLPLAEAIEARTLAAIYALLEPERESAR